MPFVRNYLKRIKLLAALQQASPRTPGERLRMLRRLVDMTQTEIAKIGGVSVMTISSWEAGKNKKMDAKAILKIGLHFGVAARWLVCMSDDPASFMAVAPEEQEILAFFRNLPTEQQKTVRTILEQMAHAYSVKPSEVMPFPAASDKPASQPASQSKK